MEAKGLVVKGVTKGLVKDGVVKGGGNDSWRSTKNVKLTLESVGKHLIGDVEYDLYVLTNYTSTDKTADIIRLYEKNYPTIFKPIYQSENQYSKKVKIPIGYLTEVTSKIIIKDLEKSGDKSAYDSIDFISYSAKDSEFNSILYSYWIDEALKIKWFDVYYENEWE